MRSGSPLLDALAGCRTGGDGELDVGADLGPQDGPGWVAAAALLADPASFDALVDGFGRDSGTDRRDIAGAFLLSDLGFAVLLRSATAFLAARRVPSLAHDAIWLRLHPEHWVDRVAFGGAFACLPDDAAAGHPDATVVPDERALLEHLLRDFRTHQEPLVGLVHARCRRPRAALWRHSGDTVAEAFMWAGEVLGARDEAWAWGRRAVAAAPEPLGTHVGYRLFQHAGLEQVGRVRAQCCLNYRCTPSSYCFSCPLKDEAHRLRRMEERAERASAA